MCSEICDSRFRYLYQRWRFACRYSSDSKEPENSGCWRTPSRLRPAAPFLAGTCAHPQMFRLASSQFYRSGLLSRSGSLGSN